MFTDRTDAGRQLADRLRAQDLQDPVILALPRGGVPVAAVVADALHAPLDVLVVRKIGCPWQPELGVGALGEGDVRLLNRGLMAELGLSEADLEAVTERERAELERRVDRYRGDRPPVSVQGRTAVVVDDGIATGFTARAAVDVVRHRGAARVVLAVPVAPPAAVDELAGVADDVVCLGTPSPFGGIGRFYRDFSQTSDEEVIQALAAARRDADPDGAGTPDPERAPVDPQDVLVHIDDAELPGLLRVPADPVGLVVFAHGSGSSRHSPRNNAVADDLARQGLATLLFDLLVGREANDRRNVFDIELLARRLSAAARWARDRADVGGLPLGYFGASTGAAAALTSAADLGHEVAAVVSRGGRPDLGERLEDVTAPTLLIVGSLDVHVLELNRRARQRLPAPSELEIVDGATHLFEEPGALEAVSDLAARWFLRHLAGDGRAAL